MIKLISSDDKSGKEQKNLKKTKHLFVGLSNGTAVYTFATEPVIDMVKESFEFEGRKLVSFKCYDAEYHDDGSTEVMSSEIMFWSNEMSSIKILELIEAPYVEE